jgi:hypothetical protein
MQIRGWFGGVDPLIEYLTAAAAAYAQGDVVTLGSGTFSKSIANSATVCGVVMDGGTGSETDIPVRVFQEGEKFIAPVKSPSTLGNAVYGDLHDLYVDANGVQTVDNTASSTDIFFFCGLITLAEDGYATNYGIYKVNPSKISG